MYFKMTSVKNGVESEFSNITLATTYRKQIVSPPNNNIENESLYFSRLSLYSEVKGYR